MNNNFKRPDNIVKDNLLYTKFVNKYNNKFVIEDFDKFEHFEKVFDKLFPIEESKSIYYNNKLYKKYYNYLQEYILTDSLAGTRFFDNGNKFIFITYELYSRLEYKSFIYNIIIDLTKPFDSSLLMSMDESYYDKFEYNKPGFGNNEFKLVPYEFIKNQILNKHKNIFNRLVDKSKKYGYNNYIIMTTAQYELLTGSKEYRYTWNNKFKNTYKI